MACGAGQWSEDPARGPCHAGIASISQAPGIFGPVLPESGHRLFIQAHASRGGGLGGQVTGDHAGIVGAKGAAHAGQEHPGQGMRIHIRCEGLIGTGADIHRDAALGQ